MRRAVVRAFRTNLQCSTRTFPRTGRRLPLVNRHPNLPHSSLRSSPSVRHLSHTSSTSSPLLSGGRLRPPPQYASGEPIRSSMFVRRASFALVSALVGYGAWYGYSESGASNANKAVSRAYSSSSITGDGALPTRSVLVIGADELHTGTFVGEDPISKTTEQGRKVVEMLTPEQATEKLRKDEQSYFINRGRGVVRYDLVQLASNDPIEDDHAEKIVEVPDPANPDESSDWMFWGVYDGHSGWTTSAKLRQSLINSVAREINSTYRAANGLVPSDEAISRAMKTGFTRLDDEIVHQSVQKVLQAGNKVMGAEVLAPALSGSCALLSFYDSRSKFLHVACTGDSRAVLGRRSTSGKWTATSLSIDQTGSNPDEVARLRKEHPGEEHVVRNGRVLGGLEPTRAFGDASYKWTREVSDRLRRQYFGRSQSPLLKTPPYVTAEPVVTTTKMNPERGDFVVMATDGLWEMLTNEEVVGLVGKWIESQASAAAASSGSQFDSVWSKIFGSSKSSGLPVEASSTAGDDTADGQKTPIRVQQWGLSPDAKDRFVVQDKNAATHLVRNALGGKNQEQVSALLTLPSPFSRRYRDDLTVQVIFFGYGEKTGEVVLNKEATASAEPALKAKL
ncbi:hypothetical protein VTK73DRAFT_59 [Phialemonium thermophilum]|uniref:PPM-type phosphatase domain-containing protein n=1 Tax=Phialemonium thermophilum TaxID=223376 RepID=A0ABR3Y7S8_9PEZI